MNFEVKTIGNIRVENGKYSILIKPEYREGLTNIEGFSYLNIFWWANRCAEKDRDNLIEKSPYKKSPNILGVFATRSPFRPNPIALTPIYVFNVDHENGVINFPYIDAENNTPVIDIKPYHPSLDRIKNVELPQWCRHWPKCYEDSANFDWENEFQF